MCAPSSVQEFGAVHAARLVLVAIANMRCCMFHYCSGTNQTNNVSSAAGSVPQQGLHCTAHFRSTQASSSWHCGTATRCATSTLLSCPTATWARTLLRCRAVAFSAATCNVKYDLLWLRSVRHLMFKNTYIHAGVNCNRACNAGAQQLDVASYRPADHAGAPRGE
jgi:hypothetical protein